MCVPLVLGGGVRLRIELGRTTGVAVALALGLWRRSVCVPLVLGGGVRLRIKCLERYYVRAKNLKCGLGPLKNWRFKTRFFASFLFAFEKK